MARGTLVLVVGPSGAGKDSLIDGARRRLTPGGRFVFARRVITRGAEAGGEAHEAVEAASFAARRAAGDFLLDWSAHGFDYGVPIAVERDLAAGRHVVANVSRGVIAAAAARATPVLVVEVTAPPEVLAGRLAARGREDAADVASRLRREGARVPAGITHVVVVNDGTLEDGIDRFIAALDAIA
ncbi:MAG: phosphonate metabolism protein/1,5-bisphosphokinase (PRPP-forming) PhnN [Alphaproteobacteria bacterium]|nr:phosphonate metabolism protein/1,5-bisphosphokinase (PRPP-forming) PhnN [Alphaproteobacteria bacterium]